MSQKLEELPLFPLSTVLFPYAQVQLHVFEDRYRQMVHDCVEEERPFGIVLIKSDTTDGSSDPYMVGTAVRIVKVQDFDDGRMDIQVKGERRFRIRKLVESGAYPVGLVEPVIELEIEPAPKVDALAMRAREDFQLWIKRLFERDDMDVQVRFPDDVVVLSFTIANLLPIENLEKQRLLEITDTIERLQGLIPLLEHQIISVDDQRILSTEGPAGSRKLNSTDLSDWLFRN